KPPCGSRRERSPGRHPRPHGRRRGRGGTRRAPSVRAGGRERRRPPRPYNSRSPPAVARRFDHLRPAPAGPGEVVGGPGWVGAWPSVSFPWCRAASPPTVLKGLGAPFFFQNLRRLILLEKGCPHIIQPVR